MSKKTINPLVIAGIALGGVAVVATGVVLAANFLKKKKEKDAIEAVEKILPENNPPTKVYKPKQPSRVEHVILQRKLSAQKKKNNTLPTVLES